METNHQPVCTGTTYFRYLNRSVWPSSEAGAIVDILVSRSSVNAAAYHPDSRSQVAPASLLQFHQADHSRFCDLRLRDERDIFRFRFRHIFPGVPACRKGKLRHGFAHRLDARFDGRSVLSQHVQSGSKGDHLDLNLLADLVVVLNCVAHVVENEIS
jgi:hypothetical protein